MYYFQKYFTESRGHEESLFQIAKWLYDEYEIKLTRDEIIEAFESFNYNVFAGEVKNCIKIVPETDSSKSKSDSDPSQKTF